MASGADTARPAAEPTVAAAPVAVCASVAPRPAFSLKVWPLARLTPMARTTSGLSANLVWPRLSAVLISVRSIGAIRASRNSVA